MTRASIRANGRVQAGHSAVTDEHDLYGFDVATEKEARKLKTLPLDPEIDYSIFRVLDFDAIAKRKRVAGPPKRNIISASMNGKAVIAPGAPRAGVPRRPFLASLVANFDFKGGNNEP